MSRSRNLLFLILFLSLGTLQAQGKHQSRKDLRDVVKTKAGKEVRGRVLRFYGREPALGP